MTRMETTTTTVTIGDKRATAVIATLTMEAAGENGLYINTQINDITYVELIQAKLDGRASSPIFLCSLHQECKDIN